MNSVLTADIFSQMEKINHEKSKQYCSIGDYYDIDDSDEMDSFFAAQLGAKKDKINQKVIQGKIYKIKGNDVIVDMGLKNYGRLAKDDLRIGMNELAVKVGDEIPVVAESIDARNNQYIKSSWEKAQRLIHWDEFTAFKNDKTVLYGSIVSETRGGYIANIRGLKCFVPGSHLEFKPLDPKALHDLMKQEQPFIILSMERSATKDNIVVSRREVLNLERMKVKDLAIDKIKIGDILTGVVKSIAPYGCFINLKIPGLDVSTVDGLLHINEMFWHKISHPSEALSLGDEVQVKVINLLPEERKISLGMKQLNPSPWQGLSERLAVGSKVKGVIKNTADYGYFVEIENSIEGLVHVSEISWSKKNMNMPVGQEVEVIILAIDEEKARISLSIKQCQENPWKKFASEHKLGDTINVTVAKIVDFGVFVNLGADIEGLIHISDISWENDAQKISSSFKIGSSIPVKILAIDADKGRVALGIKQLERDYFEEFINQAKVGDLIENCTILGSWNDKLDVDVADAKTTITIEGPNLPADFHEEKQGKYAKGRTITCKILEVSPEARKIIIALNN